MRQTARTAGSVAVLALLVCACVFAALTGPAVSLRTRTQALSQTMATTSPVIKTVQVDAPWDQFTSAIAFGTGGFGLGNQQDLTPAQFAATQREIGRGLARQAVPLAAGAWSGLASRLLPVTTGAGPLAFAGVNEPPEMEVTYRNALPANAQLVAGSYAHEAPLRGALAGAVTTQMAARFGLHPGSRVVLSVPAGPVRILITAIVRIREPDSAFWAKDATVGVPSRNIGRGTCGCWVGSIFADPDQFIAVQSAFGSSSIDIQWVYPLAVGGLSADGTQALLDDLNRAGAVPLGLTGVFAPAVSTAAVATPLVPVLSGFLVTQAAVIVNVLEQAATHGEPEPALDPDRARDTLQLLFIPRSERARVFDASGALVTDSYVLGDRVEWRPLPPVRRPGDIEFHWPAFGGDRRAETQARADADLKAEVDRALKGVPAFALRRAANGERVVSVSVPIQNVQAVLGVLTLESGDVDQIVAAQRWALAPFIMIAIIVIVSSSLLLTRLIAQPVLRLARAADRVTLARAREISLPDIARRDDELGDLTRSLEAMTRALSERMDAIERFAADVAHEIRNPLTSIRSAVETLDLISDPAARDRLTGILKHDVDRLDRLITDISNASRVDAELSREHPVRLDLGRLLADIASFYAQTASPAAVPVRFISPDAMEPVTVLGREGPLSQVFRNLIDNARSFSSLSAAPAPEVRLSVQHAGRRVVAAVEDDGPGLPPENLETVFERFYTARPKGAVFGGHSGLGLSIARQIVEAHGGEIRAENRTDETGRIVGARFVVSLPQARG